ncbi:hypothetical protein, partial [Staphylococcus aureus]
MIRIQDNTIRDGMQ